MMSIRYFAALAALALVTLATGPTPSWSQDDAPRRERGGEGGGRGGFGGGFGGPGGGMMGGMTRPDNMMSDLLRQETVRKEIELMPDQEEALKKMAEKLGERARGERPNFNFREASEAEQKAFMEKMQAEMSKRATEVKEQLEEILLPAQFERLEQIAVQARGAMGIVTHADTTKALAVTTEQTDKIKAEMQTFGESMREQFGEMFRSGDREKMAAKMKEVRKEMEGKVLAVLDDKQKADFEKLKGTPFELPDMPMGGRGFGGPGGDRGPGGPGGDRGPGGPGGDRGGRGRPAAE